MSPPVIERLHLQAGLMLAGSARRVESDRATSNASHFSS